MGEVYRAKDTRLGREVAIKILPADVASDPGRLARFEREAKAVSALNHPHIVTLHEVGTGDAGPYLVLEKIDGQSLRDLLKTGPLPLRRLLALGAQIAAGLAKAHLAGIVHRDLKPDNVMVTGDGFAKILDFGLARLTWPDGDAKAIAEASTVANETATGMILGTLGYLSPEQAAGKPADYRADQFALGVLLYEMAAGERPFRRDTALESLTATIREEPEPLRLKRPDLPAQLGWLVERCLAKNPDDRYASTKDLARDLADLGDHLSDLTKVASTEAVPVAAPARRRLLWILAPIALAAVAAASFVAARLTSEEAPLPSYQPLTFRRGIVTGARFGPDGKTVYYSAAYGAEPSRVFATRLDGTESELLKLPPGILLSVSSKNELAVLVTNGRNIGTASGTLVRVPALGGTPRALVEDAMNADWAPDGERMFVARSDSRLEFPIGQRIGGGWSWWVRIAPIGDRMARVGPGVLEIADLQGKRLVSHTTGLIYGAAWSPDGREVWYTGSESGSGADRALYALSLSGQRRLIARGPGAITVFDVGPDGRSALISTGAGWFGINAARIGEIQEQSLDLLGRSTIVGLSADGKWMLARENREVGAGAYLRSTDGKQTIYLGKDPPSGLSPDGAWALVYARENPARLTLVPTAAGAPRELPSSPRLEINPILFARWSRDGRQLFAALRPAGQDDRSYRIYVRDGERPWQAVTPAGTAGFFTVSPDGGMVATYDDSGVVALFPTAGGAPRRLEGERGVPIHWSADGRQLFLRDPVEFPARIYRRDLATGRVEPWRHIAPADPSGVFMITAVILANDGQSYVYQYSRASNDLYLAQGLR